jgi:hypothetical protein
MANHVRTQIRDAAVTAMGSLSTVTSSNIFKARPDEHDLQTSQLPAIIVYTDAEDVEAGTLNQSGRRLIRTMQLMVRGLVKATGDTDATLDTINKEVEAALASDPTFVGKAKDCLLIRVEKDRNAEGEKPIAHVEMTFEVEYHTAAGVPDVALA